MMSIDLRSGVLLTATTLVTLTCIVSYALIGSSVDGMSAIVAGGATFLLGSLLVALTASRWALAIAASGIAIIFTAVVFF